MVRKTKEAAVKDEAAARDESLWLVYENVIYNGRQVPGYRSLHRSKATADAEAQKLIRDEKGRVFLTFKIDGVDD